MDCENEFLLFVSIYLVLVRDMSKKDFVRIVYLVILELWFFFLLCFLCVVFLGIIVWVLVSKIMKVIEKF